MRYACILPLLAILAGCSTPPYTPAPKIQLPSIAPVEGVASKVKLGNRAIADSTRSLQSKLDDTRSRLDAAIVESHQANIDARRLDQSLAAASASLDAALAESHALATRVSDQDATIDDLQKQVGSLKTEQAEAQGKVDDQTEELTQSRKELAELRKLKEEVNANWGLGGIWYGIKRLGWRVLILLVVLAGLGFLLNMFVPLARPILNTMAMFFVGLGKTIWGLISRLWQKKPPS